MVIKTTFFLFSRASDFIFLRVEVPEIVGN